MFGCPGRVGVMLADAQVGLVHVVQQAVEDVWRLAHSRRDHLRMEWAVKPGDVRVKHEPWVDQVAAGTGQSCTACSTTCAKETRWWSGNSTASLAR